MAEGPSKTTKDHDTIRAWPEQRGGRPATVAGTAGDAGITGINLRDDNSLDEVAPEAFFARSDDLLLASLYQDRTSDGEVSRFNGFARRDKAS